MSTSYRSSREEVFCKKGFLKNFAKFTEKELCQSLHSKKVSGLSLQIYCKKKTLTPVLSCEIGKIFRSSCFIEHLWTTASLCRLLVPNVGSFFIL